MITLKLLKLTASLHYLLPYPGVGTGVMCDFVPIKTELETAIKGWLLDDDLI